MGIDLLENSELGALSSSRLGNKCFIDDEDYSNFSLRGHKYHDRKRAEQVSKSGQWDIDPSKSEDCNYLQDRLKQLQNTLEGRIGQAGRKYKTEAETRVLKGYETTYKNKIDALKCLEIKQQVEKEAEEKKNLEAINKVASTPIEGLIPEEKPTTKSNATKYILIGVGGFVLVITAVLLLRRN